MTRNTTQATNALYALEAARAALRTADKTLSDALAIVERNCPREYGSKDGYDATHPTYQAYKRTREALEEARRYYYMEYLTTANGAVKRGDAETFWQTITRYATYSALPPNKSLYDDVNWAAAKSGDDRHMWAYVQQFRYDDDEKDSIEDHIFSNPSEQASQRALLARIRLRSEPDIATSLYPPIKAASTSRLIEAAGRWRNEITARASDGNTLWESDARIAHALVCCELTRRNRITASDLAELIETMSGQHTFHDLTLNTPHGRQHVTNVEELIDAATPHMTR